MALEFKLSFGDYYRALVGQMFRRLWFFHFCLLATVGIFSLNILVPSLRLGAPDFITIWVVPLGWLALMFGLPVLSARAVMKSPSVAGLIKYTFSARGFDVQATASSGHSDWAVLKKVLETNAYLFLFLHSNTFYLIPKRAASAEDLLSIRKMLKEHVAGKVRLRH